MHPLAQDLGADFLFLTKGKRYTALWLSLTLKNGSGMSMTGRENGMTMGTENSVPDSKMLPEKVSRKRLINLLNHVNFKGSNVVVRLTNLEDGSIISLRARPEPCTGDVVYLTWSEVPPGNMKTQTYELSDFLVDKGSRVIVVEARLADIGGLGISVVLPEQAYSM
jgi:hypothetical protein